MSKKASRSSDKNTKSPVEVLIARYGLFSTVVTALLAAIGVGLTAYFGYLGIREQTETPINATQTTQARMTAVILSLTPTAPTPYAVAPSSTPSATADYSGTTVIAIADFYRSTNNQVQVDKIATADIVDELVRRTRNISRPIKVIRLNRIVEDAVDASTTATQFSGVKSVIVAYGRIEILQKVTILSFSIQIYPNQALLPIAGTYQVTPEQVENGILRIEYPAQIGAAFSYVLGQEAYLSKDYREAINLLRDSLIASKTIDNWVVHYYLANALYLSGSTDHNEIITEYKRVTELSNVGKVNALAAYNWGVVCYNDTNIVCAKERWETAASLDPTFFLPYFNLGVLRLKDEDWSGAREKFQAAITANPDSGESYDGLGTALCQLNDFSAAVKAWRTAVQKSPNYCSAYYNLAFGYFRLDQKQDSIDTVRKSLDCNPKYAPAWLLLGTVLNKSNMPKEARDACLQFAALSSELDECGSILGTPTPP